jgi:hypothetical protein
MKYSEVSIFLRRMAQRGYSITEKDISLFSPKRKEKKSICQHIGKIQNFDYNGIDTTVMEVATIGIVTIVQNNLNRLRIQKLK